MVRVLPEHRGRGVGARIYEALSQHARKLGRESLWGRVREDDAASRDFVRNRGFREAGREYEVVLDTAHAEAVPDRPPESISSRSPSGPTSSVPSTRSTARSAETYQGRKGTTSGASLSTAGASSTSRAPERSPTR